jgi:hypothetical protein
MVDWATYEETNSNDGHGKDCDCPDCTDERAVRCCEFCFGPKDPDSEMCETCAADKAANPEEWR